MTPAATSEATPPALPTLLPTLLPTPLATICAHCGLPLPRRPVHHTTGDGETRAFCCDACCMVYCAICEAGLDAYYERRGTAPLKQADGPKRLDWLNQPQVQAAYVTVQGGFVEASFLLDGLHCAACSWLIEHAVGRIVGVEEARVNYATSRLRVRWREGVIGLGDVVAAVSAIGYRATPYHPARSERPRAKQSNDLLMRMAVAGFSAGNVMLIAVALYAGDASGIEPGLRHFFHYVCLVLATLTVTYCAVPFYRGALSAIRARGMTMDIPICLGLLTTFFYSAWSALSGHADVYFDTVAMFVFVLLIGRVVENGSRGRVSSAVERLLALGPRAAAVLVDGVRTERPVEEVVPGDHVELLPGDRVPVDGRVLDGTAWVDESMLTGEPVPRSVAAGSELAAGTVCQDGRLVVEATRTGSSTTLARISQMVEDAQMRRAPVQRIVDRVARWFVSLTISLALISYFVWLPSRGHEGALMIAVSVLIITCPCALGLATPLAVACAGGRSAGRGVLFRGGDVLEALHSVTHLLIDKTGTLTEGRFELAATVVDGIAPDEALRLAAAVETYSRHPLAVALAAAGPAELPAVTDFASRPGHGVRGTVEGRRLRLQRLDTLQADGLVATAALEAQADALASKGNTMVWLAVDDRIVAAFALADRIRPEAADIVRGLQQRGLQVEVVSGDSVVAARAIGEALGIPVAHGRMLPEDKAARVRVLQAAGHRVALVGDGINDAPALSAADVGVAVSCGTDVATEAADVVLLRAGLGGLLEAVDTARATFRTIRDNITISSLYNCMALPMAVSGHVAPLLAAVAMPLSSLLVVASSMRLWRGKGN